MRLLAKAVGDGDLVAKCEVSQRYAEVQERHREFNHPRGGKAGYLGDHLVGSTSRYMRELAERLVTPDGSEIQQAARDIADDLSAAVRRDAPVEFDFLRRSGHATVTDNGEVIHDKGPEVPRLSDEQLRDRHRRHDLDGRPLGRAR
jgi:hypothetical protein